MRKIYKKNNISIKCVYIDDMIYYREKFFYYKK